MLLESNRLKGCSFHVRWIQLRQKLRGSANIAFPWRSVNTVGLFLDLLQSALDAIENHPLREVTSAAYSYNASPRGNQFSWKWFEILLNQALLLCISKSRIHHKNWLWDLSEILKENNCKPSLLSLADCSIVPYNCLLRYWPMPLPQSKKKIS